MSLAKTVTDLSEPRTIEKIAAVRRRAVDVVERGRPVALFAARAAVGLVFLSTGWGKVHNIPGVTEYFTSLGIPAPGLNAVVVAWSELLCGGAIVLGLLTRLATVPLIVSMVVAILTAKRAELGGLFDLVGFEEFTYAVVLAVIAVLGPGALSIDAVVARKIDETKPSPRP